MKQKLGIENFRKGEKNLCEVPFRDFEKLQKILWKPVTENLQNREKFCED